MSDSSPKTAPILTWYVRLERVEDEQAALDAWRALVRAQGWSPVGDPEVVHDGATPVVEGRLVKLPCLTISADAARAGVVMYR